MSFKDYTACSNATTTVVLSRRGHARAKLPYNVKGLVTLIKR